MLFFCIRKKHNISEESVFSQFFYPIFFIIRYESLGKQ